MLIHGGAGFLPRVTATHLAAATIESALLSKIIPERLSRPVRLFTHLVIFTHAADPNAFFFA